MSNYETIVLAHGCRQVSELAYGEHLVEACAITNSSAR